MPFDLTQFKEGEDEYGPILCLLLDWQARNLAAKEIKSGLSKQKKKDLSVCRFMHRQLFSMLFDVNAAAASICKHHFAGDKRPQPHFDANECVQRLRKIARKNPDYHSDVEIDDLTDSEWGPDGPEDEESEESD